MEEEQKGKERAEYGKKIIKELSNKLTIFYLLIKSRYFDESYYSQYNKSYKEHPFYESPDFIDWFRKIIRNSEFKITVSLSNCSG